MNPERTVVTVSIAGEDYNILALASPEYTRECAAYVDRALAEYMRRGGMIQAHKAAILVALSLTDELFQARQELETLKAEVTERADALSSQITERLAAPDLAGGS